MRGSHATQQLRTPVRGTLASLPPIVQPGTTPAAPSDDGTLVATFDPADPGNKVTLERQGRRGWKPVATGTEDAWGSAAFSPGPGTYRARTTSDGRTWVTGVVTTARWRPEFEDTFSGTTLDTTVWNDQRREHESVYAPRTCARVDAAARRVSEGVLHLGVAADPARVGLPCDYTTTRGSGTSPYLLNSQVATEYTRFFQHGIVAARIKPQRAKGMHSGFWMLPSGTKYADGTPAAGTEIDIMEFFGETRSRQRDHRVPHPLLRGGLGQGQPRRHLPGGPARAGQGPRLVGRVPRLLGGVDPHGVHLPRRRPRVLPRDRRPSPRPSSTWCCRPSPPTTSSVSSTPGEIADTAQVDWVRVYGDVEDVDDLASEQVTPRAISAPGSLEQRQRSSAGQAADVGLEVEQGERVDDPDAAASAASSVLRPADRDHRDAAARPAGDADRGLAAEALLRPATPRR